MKYHHININVKIVGAVGISEFGPKNYFEKTDENRGKTLREAQKVVFHLTESESDCCSQCLNRAMVEAHHFIK